MLQKFLMSLAVSSMILVGSAYADNMKPGEGVTVTPARATWNTGFFQEALVRRGLGELGFDVKKPTDLQNPIFYKSVALGDVDYWTNGWFPNHDGQLPDGFYDVADKVGYVVKAGGLQGYLVSKKHVEEFGIKSLDDFKRDEVKKAFDKNKDGKADLTACPPAGAVKRSSPIIWTFMISTITLTRSRQLMKPAWPQRWLSSRAASRYSSIPGLPTGPSSN